MHAALTHIARRGYEAVRFQPKDEYQYNIPTWGIVMFATTVFFFFVASFAIEYTFGRVVPTLVVVESPQAALYEPLDTIDPDAPVAKTTDSEVLLVKQKPITSSFRSTIKHLHSKGGFRARFRGLALFVIYSFLISLISKTISVIPFVPVRVAPVFAALLLANWSLTWTHIVISDPSPKTWFRRLAAAGGAKSWKKVAGPTAILAIAEQLSIALPEVLARIYGLDRISHQDAVNLSGSEKQAVALKTMSILILGLVLGFFLVIPTSVILTRVQASLLADDQESIVPFDRSFGGKVIPEIVGGSGVVGLRDAWNTFDRNARVRLIKTYVKVFAMQTALMLCFIGVIVAQIFIVIGKSDLKKIITNPEDGGKAGSFM